MPTFNNDNTRSGYLHTILNAEGLRLTIPPLQKLIEKHAGEFETIVVRGMSGALVAPILAMNMHKNMVIIRKDKHEGHSGLEVEGPKKIGKFIIIDDLVSTGSTISVILTTLSNTQAMQFDPQLNQGIFLYSDYVSESSGSKTFHYKKEHETGLRTDHSISIKMHAMKINEVGTLVYWDNQSVL